MLRKEFHPISGATYEAIGDGRVRVTGDKQGKGGVFHWDGTWIEGELKHADPHFLLYIGGPDLPHEQDVYWGMLPVEAAVTATAASPGSAYGGGGLGAASGVAASGGTLASATKDDAIASAPVADPMWSVHAYTGDPGMDTPVGKRSLGFLPLDLYMNADRKPERVPEAYKLESPCSGGSQKIPTARYYKKEYHDLEVERVWKKAWQMACLEDDIPEVGDYNVYEIANLSFLVVRVATDQIKAYYNACLHRGRLLREFDGKTATEFRCPYHGWSWRIDGSLKEMTCEWDFGPEVRQDVANLPEVQVGTWSGFVFINPDPEAMPLAEFLGPVMVGHYENFRFAGRYKQVHVQKVMHANWKVTMEAFMEAYHVIATHPQLMLAGGSDGVNLRYDVFGHWGRAGHMGSQTSSPLRGVIKGKEEAIQEHLAMADMNREYLRGIIGDEADRFSDAELNDTNFNDLFPNLHPWGGWARIVFRFRPLGDNVNATLMDVIYLAPWPSDKPKPPAAKPHFLRADQSWCEAPELGSLAKIIDQDVYNLPKVQAGLKTKREDYIWYSSYQEGKIRNFHENYERWMGIQV